MLKIYPEDLLFRDITVLHIIETLRSITNRLDIDNIRDIFNRLIDKLQFLRGNEIQKGKYVTNTLTNNHVLILVMLVLTFLE